MFEVLSALCTVMTLAHVMGLSLLFPLRLYSPVVDSKDRSRAIVEG